MMAKSRGMNESEYKTYRGNICTYLAIWWARIVIFARLAYLSDRFSGLKYEHSKAYW